MPTTTLSIAWILANPAVTSVALGASRTGQVADTLAAAIHEFDEAVRRSARSSQAPHRAQPRGGRSAFDAAKVTMLIDNARIGTASRRVDAASLRRWTRIYRRSGDGRPGF